MTERRRGQVLILKLLAYSAGLTIVLAVVFSSESPLADLPSPKVVLGQFAAAVALHLLNEVVGYRTSAIPAGTPREEATQAALVAYSVAVSVRFAVCHSLAVGSIALALLVTRGQFLTYAFGAILSTALVMYHDYPWQRPVARVRESLEREGGRSYLMETFGFDGTGDRPAAGV